MKTYQVSWITACGDEAGGFWVTDSYPLRKITIEEPSERNIFNQIFDPEFIKEVDIEWHDDTIGYVVEKDTGKALYMLELLDDY